jgi:hypothetical protein
MAVIRVYHTFVTQLLEERVKAFEPTKIQEIEGAMEKRVIDKLKKSPGLTRRECSRQMSKTKGGYAGWSRIVDQLIKAGAIFGSAIQVRLARKSRTITYWIIRVFLRHVSRRALPGSHYPITELSRRTHYEAVCFRRLTPAVSRAAACYARPGGLYSYEEECHLS